MANPTTLALAILAKVGELPSPPPDIPLAGLFLLAKTAHLNYRQASQIQQNPDAARAALTVAARLRAQIQLLDPDHLNPAWQFNGGTHPGGEMSQRALNTDLLQFYVNQLDRA